ncbi:substrate-binding domain-containing protein [Sorangium sp. So ce1153]|uniref:substrate-binding domain-containing protein n=1 Tax=Sorangium sp. So ce1153 TaxID=3133333 RepID=UPI003F5ECC09
MSIGLDLFATLHRTVLQAMDCVPGAQRGSLLLREGERLVYRAAAGMEGLLPARLHLPSDAGPASAPAPLDAEGGARVVAAAAWYGARLPGAPALERLPAGAVVVLTPVRVHGRPLGVLVVEQPGDEAPSGEALSGEAPSGEALSGEALSGEHWARLSALADSAGAALERRGLYDDKARAAHETRLLEEVLNAVAAQASPRELVEIVSKGIRSVQLRPHWSAVHLVMLDGADREGPPSSAPGQGRELRVYRLPRRAPTAYWNNLRDGALVAGHDLGVAVDFRFCAGSGAGSQSELIDEGIRRGVQGIAVAPADPALIEPAIRRATEAGIPVVTLDTPPAAGSSTLAYVGTDNAAAGRLAGEMMARLLPDGGAVHAQLTSLRALNGIERVEGFGAAVAGRAIAVQPPSENQFDTSRGLQLAEEALRREGGAGAFGACAENGPSWGRAARAAGRAGDLKIVAFDLVPETIAMIREGTIHAAVVQREYDMGYRAVQMLHDVITRGAGVALAGLPPLSPGAEPPSPRFADTGVDVVTLERTPWSHALSDHLNLELNRKATIRRRAPAAVRPALELLVVVLDVEKEELADERALLDRGSLVGRALSTARSVVVDTAASELDGLSDVLEARLHGTRTLVGVPLLTRGEALGVLVLESERPSACSPEDLAQIERVADTMAVALENVRLFERMSRRQESLVNTIIELSSPVVPIAPEILVMPVVGAMDRQRSGRFMESMLQEISRRRARVVLVDVTGMATVDALAAHHLLQAAGAARLLGAEVVLVGIAPEAARLIVGQGLDLGRVAIRATLELGFAYALSRTGGRVVYADA